MSSSGFIIYSRNNKHKDNLITKLTIEITK
jgi:hypothetical protein